MARNTVIYSPHQDDETLYLCSYITMCAARGDRLILVAVTNGEGSGAKPADWDVQSMVNVRRAEQAASWKTLTGGQTEIYYLGYADSNDPTECAKTRAGVAAFAEGLERAYAGNIEHYGACNYTAQQALCHQAVANGIKDAGVKVARFSKAPRDTSVGGTVYKPTTDKVDECNYAYNIYRAFGQLSVKTDFDALKNSGYANRIIA